MPSKRDYKVKGTKDFLVLAGIFFFLCIWAIKDAWFPGPKVLEKHPREIVMSFPISGAVSFLHVKAGDSIGKNQKLAELRRDGAEQELAEAKKAYTEAKKKHALMETAVRNAQSGGASTQGFEEMRKSWEQAAETMDAAMDRMDKAREKMDASELVAPDKGVVARMEVELHDVVGAEQPVLVIDPKDHFYLFNQSLAIFSFIAFWVFLGIHILAR